MNVKNKLETKTTNFVFFETFIEKGAEELGGTEFQTGKNTEALFAARAYACGCRVNPVTPDVRTGVTGLTLAFVLELPETLCGNREFCVEVR